MDITYKIETNGKPRYKISKEYSSLITYRGKNRIPFQVKRDNLFLSELKVNAQNPERKFVISIRRDGKKENEGQYINSQIEFNEEELCQVRDCINDILSYTIP